MADGYHVTGIVTFVGAGARFQAESRICSALALGLTLAHILKIPGKRQLSGAEWLRVQQSFYLGYAIVGAIAEVGGLPASLGIFAIERRERMCTIWPMVSAIGFAGMLGSYWFGNRPLNDRIASWTSQTLPADWSTVHDRWDTAHSISAIIAAVARASLLTQVMLVRLPRIASSRLEGAAG